VLRRRLVAALALGLGACTHRPAGPDLVLRQYLAALAGGRVDEAYSLLGADYRRTHDRAAFERSLASVEGRNAASRLRRAPTSVELRAELALPDGDRLPLELEHGQWRLARDPLEFYPQNTPVEALRSFLRAVDNHRYEVVLRFVPTRYRATITVDKLRERWEGERRGELLAQLTAVRAHLGDPLDLAGDEARLAVGERKQVKLVREDGLWKVESLE
jgi:hypothetical protein